MIQITFLRKAPNITARPQKANIESSIDKNRNPMASGIKNQIKKERREVKKPIVKIVVGLNPP